MKTSRHLLLITLFVGLFSSCSLFNNEQNDAPVDAFIANEQLIIKNNLPFDVYYIAVDKNRLALMLWAPTVTEENKIEAGRSTSVAVSEILTDNPEAPIGVYYWDKDISEIFNIDVD